MGVRGVGVGGRYSGLDRYGHEVALDDGWMGLVGEGEEKRGVVVWSEGWWWFGLWGL